MTWGEIYRAGEAALQRSCINIKKGRQDAYGAEQSGGLGLDLSWIGCIGEQAVSRHFNCYWDATAFGVVDCGGRIEVRSTTDENRRLCLHKEDRDDLPFILVRVIKAKLPVVTLAGWMLGLDAKADEWWGEANPLKPTKRLAYWVPNAELHDMHDFVIDWSRKNNRDYNPPEES